MQTFRDLNCWKTANRFRIECFEVANSFPEEEKYRLKDQLVRSSRSVGNALAEGFGRYHYQETIQYCRMARGSLEEALDHLIVARSCKYIEEETFARLHAAYLDVVRLVNGYIAYLKKRKGERST